jgi:AraC-like DNA-binding protein
MRFLVHNMAQHPAGSPVGPAVWPHFDLLFVHDGRIELRVLRKTSLRIDPGQAILLYPQTPFEGRCVEDSCFSVQHFAVEPAGASPGVPPPFKDLLRRKRGFERYDQRVAREVEADVRRAIDLARREQTPLVHQMRIAVLTLILGGLREAPPPVLPGIAHGVAFEPLIRSVQSRLDQGITIADMAAQMRLSPSHFRALFARVVGQSAGKFLLNLRISEARRLLRETQIPIKQIAKLTGYSGLVPFARSFKLHTGRTPASYRRQHVPSA